MSGWLLGEVGKDQLGSCLDWFAGSGEGPQQHTEPGKWTGGGKGLCSILVPWLSFVQICMKHDVPTSINDRIFDTSGILCDKILYI